MYGSRIFNQTVIHGIFTQAFQKMLGLLCLSDVSFFWFSRGDIRSMNLSGSCPERYSSGNIFDTEAQYVKNMV